MTEVTIREARLEDTDLILGFVKALAIYEKAEHLVLATQDNIRQSLFDSSASAKSLICMLGEVPIGFAVYFFNYSTWLGKNGLYLEDLYVAPEQRGHGAGTAILQYLARLAVDNDCGRFEWSVLDWNTPAIKFYESIGALPQEEWVGYRLDGERLHSFANR